MTVGAVIPAAGRGERLGGGLPKALRELSGTPLLTHSLRALCSESDVSEVVVVAPASHRDEVQTIVTQADIRPSVRVVAGGDSRTESVRKGVAALSPACTIVLVHDAARPLVPAELVNSVIANCRSGSQAVVPGLAVVDTIKSVDEAGRVEATVPRDKLRAIQTPQGFERTLLERALAAAKNQATDDAGLVEALGETVVVIPGHSDAMKVTRPADLVVASQILQRRRAQHGH